MGRLRGAAARVCKCSPELVPEEEVSQSTCTSCNLLQAVWDSVHQNACCYGNGTSHSSLFQRLNGIANVNIAARCGGKQRKRNKTMRETTVVVTKSTSLGLACLPGSETWKVLNAAHFLCFEADTDGS